MKQPRHRPRIISIDAAELRRMWTGGELSIAEISARLGCSHGALCVEQGYHGLLMNR